MSRVITSVATITAIQAQLIDATASVRGFMTSAQFTKLAGIATGATANSTDAYLLDRTHHTGTQASTTITGLLRPISFFFTSTPTASEVLLIYVACETITFDDEFLNSTCSVGTNPSSAYVLTIKKNGTSVGTLTISTGGTRTFTTTGTTVVLAAGDRLTVEAPAVADTTIANVSISLKGSI